MPILYHVDDIEHQMNLGSDVYDDYEVVLPEGWQLSSGDISFLKNESPEQYASIATSMLDSVTPFEDKSFEIKMSLEARKLAFDAYRKITDRIINKQDINEELILDVRSNLAKILTMVQFNSIKTAFLSHLHYGYDYQTHLTTNSLYLSLIIGNKIKQYIKKVRMETSTAKKIDNPESLTPLTISAFYRDIGMISKDPLWLKQALTESDKLMVISHPAYSCNLLSSFISPQVRQAISHHHENFNGTGFPERLPGTEINIFARVIRVSDAYCTGISTKCNNKAKHPAAVLYDMLHGNQKEQFDPEIVKALAKVVQPFEIGTKLLLQDGTTAIVTGHTPGKPFSPNIVVIYDADGNVMPQKNFERPINLARRKDLKIQSAKGHDVSFLYSQDAS